MYKANRLQEHKYELERYQEKFRDYLPWYIEEYCTELDTKFREVTDESEEAVWDSYDG